MILRGVVLLAPWLGLSGLARGEGREPSPIEDELYQLIMAAQVLNLESPDYQEGRLDFDIEYQPPPAPHNLNPQPVRARGKTIWKGETSLWVYRAQAPDERNVFGSPLVEALESAPTQYFLFDRKQTYAYNHKTNTLHRSRRVSEYHSLHVLNVNPHDLWFRCRSPVPSSGRSWAEMIARGGPVIGPGDRVSIAREGGHIRHTREIADGGTSTITFSLQWDGNVVHSRYSGANRDERDVERSYEWGRDEDGLCILKRYEFKEFEPGSDTKLHQSLSITLDSVDLRRPVSAGDVSPRSLIAMLPRDVFINDRIAGKRYFPNPGVKPPRIEFDRLAEIVAGEGFLVKD
ncbi:hypothetical protein AB1L88_13160 [Tautonia sp. JC769]|uniref:hypothetical protein n=1 Tax=Tautonia sp. JC769 TaxID=3232135 RepID=UPI0034586E5F